MCSSMGSSEASIVSYAAVADPRRSSLGSSMVRRTRNNVHSINQWREGFNMLSLLNVFQMFKTEHQSSVHNPISECLVQYILYVF